MCEDFETGHALEEVCSNVDTVSGDMRIVAGEGVSGGHALESAYAVGRVENGWCHIGFGRSPLASSLRSAEDFAEIYWRVRVRMDTSFIPQGGIKLTRTMSFSGADWSQAWVAGLWSTTSGEGALIADPASCVATVSASAVDCVGYNDLAHLRWLGPFGVGSNNLFASAQAGVWHCVEGHLRLNTPGVADGVFEYWTDGQLRGSRTDLSFRGSWTGYGINDILLDGYWDGGSPTPTKRWLDDVVIAESRIGCD